MIVRDGDWTLVSHDVKLGRTVWSMRNGDGSITYRTDYAVDPTIEANTAMRNMASPGWKGDYHKVASVPLNLFYDKLNPAIQQDDNKFLSRWLNDSDNRAWRTKEGRI